MRGNLVLLHFPTQYLLASTFIRFQEHYEGNEFRNRIFTLEEYMDWYAHERGAFTYLQDWGGFNIPSSALESFYNGKFDPLMRKEQWVLRILADIPRPFYVVGVYGKHVHLPTLKHELAHGLYATVPAYRDDVIDLLCRFDVPQIAMAFEKMSYHPAVWNDEMNAYLLTSLNDLKDAGLRPDGQIKALRKALQALFLQHFSFSLSDATFNMVWSQFRFIMRFTE